MLTWGISKLLGIRLAILNDGKMLQFTRVFTSIFRGFQFIWDNLRMEDVTCYWEKLLTSYADLVKYTPKRDSSYKEVGPNWRDEL